jgi:Icc-related predicted phosphoesterase
MHNPTLGHGSRLLVIGDTHCRFDVLEQVIAREQRAGVAAVLHCGDIGIYDQHSPERLSKRERYLIEKHKNPVELCYPFLDGSRRLPVPLLGIPGNHEDFQLVDELEQGQRELEGFRLLVPGEQVRFELGERAVSVMGLGRILPEGMSPKRRPAAKFISREAIHATLTAARTARPDILLLHEAPHLSTVAKHRVFGSTELLDLVEEIQPRLAIFGHMHLELKAQIGPTEVYGVGYGAYGRYGTVDDQLRFHFRDLNGRLAAPRETTPVRPVKPAKRAQAEQRHIHSLQKVPLPLEGREVIRHFNLGRLHKRERKRLEQLFIELRKISIERGSLSREEALTYTEEFLRKSNLIS